MSERYTRVFSLPENLYALGSPVVISAGALLKDNQTGKVLAQLKLTNIQYKKIKAVKAKLFPLDTMGQSLGEAIDYQYLDLQLTRDGDFGSKTPIPFPDATTRAFAVEVTAVVFVDNTAWNSDGAPWEPIPDSIPLHRQYNDLVIEQLRLEQSGTCQFVVQEHKDLWLCACGAVNHDGEARCHDCGKQLSQLHPLDFEALTERANLRLAEEARQAAEEKAARDAAAEASKKKTAKIFKIAIPVVCAAIAFVILLNAVIIPNSKYNKAVSLMEAGRYVDAIAAFEAMNGYKDSADQIVKCGDAIIAAEQTRIEAEIAAIFDRAEELLSVGDYDGAIAFYESLTDYQGSSECIATVEAAKIEAAYKTADVLAKSEKSGEAAIAFAKLGDYQDAHQRSMELWNSIAVRDSLSTGRFHTVGLKIDGTTLAVGFNQYGQCDVSGWTDIIAVSAGGCFTVGLRPDGTVVSTGANEDGQCNVHDWKNIVAVSTGEYHTVGLKSDGTVVATGWNQYNQCNVENWTDIVAIGTGQYHTIGLKSNGEVVAVGWNKHSQCNTDSWTDIVAIAAGEYHTVGLKSNGTVVVVGNNTDDWFEVGYTSSKGGFIAATNHNNTWCNVNEWTDIVAIDAGICQTIGIRSDGTVIAVGDNVHGRCDIGNWTDIVSISTRNIHTVGLKADGTLVTVGSNEDGQCDVSSWKNIKFPN